MTATEAETVEKLAEERAIEIIDALKATYRKQFGEELGDDVIVEQIEIKIMEAKASLCQHMLRQLCSTVLEPADFYRAKKMLIERNTPKEETNVKRVVKRAAGSK